MTILSSISAQRRTHGADPEPWVWADGTRHADLPPMRLELVDGITRDTSARVTHDPRPDHQAPQVHPANPILDAARDTWDDNWGSALAWGFAVASALDWLDSDVPESMGYRPGIHGSGADLTDGSWEAAEVVSLLGLGVVDDDPNGPVVTLDPEPDDDTTAAAVPILTHALRVLERIIDLTPEADRY